MATFESSARSIDMLGRQQIAGLPTALSEVFKNAYDAYATLVRGDFYPLQGVLTIRDDGVGMTMEDFRKRWLTVGTGSKTGSASFAPVRVPAGLHQRRQMGEKGIGRLAVATAGAQLLVLTRATTSERDDPLPLTVALVQWTMFELPGLNLSDVVIPVRSVAGVDEVTPELLQDIAQEARQNLVSLGSRVREQDAERIEAQLDRLDFDPRLFARAGGFSPLAEHGTVYIVRPVSDDLPAVMATENSSDADFEISDFQRFLLGFTNTITPGSSVPQFRTEFVRHEKLGPVDLISDALFWDTDDFSLVDHVIEGTFDERGQFVGTVDIYRSGPEESVEPWLNGGGQTSACGPFSIKFGYVQGRPSDSILPAEDFQIMTGRLNRLGGLYIYRDGIRVLPYGNSDVDYLEIEKRRSLNAGTAYFSYRRMFGAISISSGSNPALQEKAGREGFRENAAYRDFRDILTGFFKQLATSYFSAKGAGSSEWRERRTELGRRTHQQRQDAAARLDLEHAMERAVARIENGSTAATLDQLTVELADAVAHSRRDSTTIAQAEAAFRDGVLRVREETEVARPPDLPLTSALEEDWTGYSALALYRDELVAAALDRAEQVLNLSPIGETASSRPSTIAEPNLVAQAAAEVRSAAASSSAAVSVSAEAAHARVVAVVRRLEEDVAGVVAAKDRGDAARELRLELQVRPLVDAALRDLRRIGERARAAQEERDDQTALQERILDLEDQAESNLELLELGQAVQIVSHEFEASIRTVRTAIHKLDPWARSTPRLQPVVRDLRASFAHLDGYLRLFTPLQRRLYRQAAQISGGEVEQFLSNVFGDRLEREHVALTATSAFRDAVIEGYPSTFYPVFTNLVDNAIYWLATSSEPREVTLDYVGGRFLVQDNGPGVRAADRPLVFERGFGRRRGGRGLGLSISRDLLARDGWTLALAEPMHGATFALVPPSSGEAVDEEH